MKSEHAPDMLKNLPITQWAEEDRPREKMVALGKKSLTNSELIAILLRTGVKGASAIDLAQRILEKSHHRLSDLARLEVSDLKVSGIGTAKAVSVLAALELGNRLLRENLESSETIIKNSLDIFYCIAPDIIDLPHEEFWALYLNMRNKVTWKQRIAEGGLNSTTVDMRKLFAPAIEHRAVSIAVAHNHPSGNLRPSKEDKALTQSIIEAGKILNIRLIDHLVVGVTPNGVRDYYSFTDNALM